MKNFTIFLATIFMLSLGFLFLLDLSFTNVYENSVPRSKFQFLRSYKNKKVDYVFLGSSRVENHIVPKIIEKEIGKKALNLGFAGSRMSDIYIALKLLKEYNIKTEKIFIQVDYNYNIEDLYSMTFLWQLMPFVKENKTTREYFNLHFSEKAGIFHIPFYRYCYFESKIGFREFLLNKINKETGVVMNAGFNGLEGNSFRHNESLPNYIKGKNKYFEKIRSFAKANKMSLYFFCAPFSRQTKNLSYVEKLKLKIPDLYDFSTIIKDDELFHDCYHLNRKGANYFTKLLIDGMLKAEKK